MKITFFFLFRSANYSFLRRGASANSGLRKDTSSKQLNLWCPVVQRTSHPDLTNVSCSSTPTTPVKAPRPPVNLIRGRSDISLPSTPNSPVIARPPVNLIRGRSDISLPSTPTTPVMVHPPVNLIRGRSDISLPSTPNSPVIARPPVNLIRGRSDISLPTTPKHLTRLLLRCLSVFKIFIEY